jgi:hypothetical protein
MDRFSELIIPRSSIESISQQEITPLMVGFAWRASVWRQPPQFIQVILMQLIAASTIFMVGMIPVDRGLNSPNSSRSQLERMERLIWVNGGMTIALLSGINWWMFERGKRYQRLIKLVEQIEDYNQIINSISTLAKVANLTAMDGSSSQNSQIFDILAQIRHNLLTAVEIDRYLRQYPNSTGLTSLARNLINLHHLAEQPELAEYHALLTQAWEIGMSVYQQTNPELPLNVRISRIAAQHDE